jgi:hypothetical protein
MEDGRLGRPCGPGAHSRAFPETRLRLRRQSRIQLPYHLQHYWRWSCRMLTARQRAASAAGTTPNRAIRRFPNGKHPRVVSADQLRVLWSSRQPSCADTAPTHLMRVDRASGLGACWSPTRSLGEGCTVVANAERAKDAAEAYRSGNPLVYDLTEVANRWRARWHSGGCRPVEGSRRRPPASARSGHCVDRRPHQQRRSS